jgi:hypothetical protein
VASNGLSNLPDSLRSSLQLRIVHLALNVCTSLPNGIRQSLLYSKGFLTRCSLLPFSIAIAVRAPALGSQRQPPADTANWAVAVRSSDRSFVSAACFCTVNLRSSQLSCFVRRQLRTLRAGSNRLESLPNLVGLTMLQLLDLSDNSLTAVFLHSSSLLRLIDQSCLAFPSFLSPRSLCLSVLFSC